MAIRHYFRLLVLIIGTGPLLGQDAIFRHDTLWRPVYGTTGAVATAEASATKAAIQVLKSGGNAADAAVCAAFTLAVTYPRAGNLGGGGFLLFHEAASGQTHALDFRETAPAGAHRDMFLGPDGNADANLSRKSPLAIGTPGTVAGLLELHERFCTLPLETLMRPAIDLARNGISVTADRAWEFSNARELDRLGPEAVRVYFGEDGLPPEAGDILLQPELADSLERISRHGRAGFYEGPVADAIVQTVSRQGGVLSLADLKNYQAVWRHPVEGDYRGYRIQSMPPPSSGGIHILQMLRLLEHFDLEFLGHNSAKSSHLMAAVMKRAYADRSQHLGDPDYYPVPVEELISDTYLQKVLSTIDTSTVVPSQRILPGRFEKDPESTETTHLSIVDAAGNAVSLTTTLNFSFGCGIMAEGTGILLNNEMDDFSAKPGVPNAYGLIGGEANAVEAGKRPLSSMSPTIVLHDGEVFLVTGSPGGSRIITTVLQMVLNVVEFHMNLLEATHAPRMHHQWLPDVLSVERGFPFDTRQELEQRGYSVETTRVMGAAQSVLREESGRLSAAADPRRAGSAEVF